MFSAGQSEMAPVTAKSSSQLEKDQHVNSSMRSSITKPGMTLTILQNGHMAKLSVRDMKGGSTLFSTSFRSDCQVY